MQLHVKGAGGIRKQMPSEPRHGSKREGGAYPCDPLEQGEKKERKKKERKKKKEKRKKERKKKDEEENQSSLQSS